LVRLFRFRQKIDEDGETLEITSKARAVSFEPDALKMGRQGSVLSAACAEGDPEIYIHRHRRQCVGRIVAEEFGDESTDEHDVVLVITERTSDARGASRMVKTLEHTNSQGFAGGSSVRLRTANGNQ
jgi:hypothetical protein